MKKQGSGSVAAAYLALLAHRGVDYLFGNAGTDFAPLIEAYAQAAQTAADAACTAGAMDLLADATAGTTQSGNFGSTTTAAVPSPDPSSTTITAA